METKEPIKSIEFDLDNCRAETARIIIAKCEEWNCTPSEAVSRLIGMLNEDGDDTSTRKEVA